MKRLLRSTLDFASTIEQEHLVQNFQKLVHANVEWLRPDDQRIYDYTLRYFQQRLEIPAFQTVHDYFSKMGDGGDVEVLERLKDIEAAPFYIRTNYSHLLQSILEEQNSVKSIALLRETHDIITKGVDFTEPGTREKTRKKGVREALVHFTSRAHDLILPEYNAKTAGDLRMDGQAIWNDYVEAKNNKDKAWGKFTGLNHIDNCCHGIKKGELWVHAAFAGELKCLAGDATVYDHKTNRRRRLKELYDCRDLPTVTAIEREGEKPRLVLAPASHLVQNGEREVFDLTLRSGRTLGATSNHKFLTLDGWKELAELSEDDFVATPKFMPTEGFRSYTIHEVKLAGYLIGDGRTEDTITFTQVDETIRNDFVSCLKGVGLIEGVADYERAHFNVNFPVDRAPYVYVSHGLGDRWHRVTSPVRLLLDRLGLYGNDSYEKRVPSEFFGLPEELLTMFLGALWSTDGSCSARDYEREGRAPQANNSIQYHSVSHGLCLDVQSLLLRLGVQSTVTVTNTTLPDGRPYRFWTTRVVTNPSKRLFCKKVRVVGKEEAFATLADRLPEDDNTPLPSRMLPDGERVMVNGHWHYARTSRDYSDTVSADVAARFGVGAGDIFWDRVKTIISRGTEMTYDLSVPGHHTFVANDIITHNTTFALNWCYNLVTRYRSNVLYFSLEMTYEQMRRQIITIHSANGKFKAQGYKPLDYRKIRDGELTPDEEVFYQRVIDDWSTNPEYCSFEMRCPDRDMTIDDIRLEAELVHKQTEIGLMVLDHGQLLEPRKTRRSKDYTIELNSIVKDTKKLALHFNHGEKIAVLMLFQINRQGREEAVKNKGKYNASAIAYANEVEKSADYITTSFIDEEHRRNGTTYITNLKNRENAIFEPFYAAVDFPSRRMHNQDMAKLAGRGMGIEDMRAQTDAMAYIQGL
jgi:intein/homing endonuclease